MKSQKKTAAPVPESPRTEKEIRRDVRLETVRRFQFDLRARRAYAWEELFDRGGLLHGGGRGPRASWEAYDREHRT